MYPSIQICSVLYGSLCGLYLFYAGKSNKSPLFKLICRALPLLSLIAIMTLLDQYKPVENTTQYYFMKMNKTVWAILFVVLGDVYIYCKMSLYKMISVIVAYSFLICVFSFDGHIISYITVSEIISLHLFGFISALAAIYSLQKLKRDIFFSLMLMQVLLSMLISWFSVTLVQLNGATFHGVLGVFGASMFYVGELVVLVTSSRGGKITFDILDSPILTVTNYAGFYCIIVSLLLE